MWLPADVWYGKYIKRMNKQKRTTDNGLLWYMFEELVGLTPPMPIILHRK